MHHAGRREVVGVGAMPGEEARVLDAMHPRADEFGGGDVAGAHEVSLLLGSARICLAAALTASTMF